MERFLIAGRSAFVPNLLLPQRAVFRLDSSAGDTGDEPPDWEKLVEVLAPLAAWVVLSGTALFLGLPVAIISSAPHWLIFTNVGIIYVSLISALVWIKKNEERLQIRSFRFWHFAFEVLACPPFGVNLVRRLSLMASVRESVGHAEARLGVVKVSDGSNDYDGDECAGERSSAIASESEIIPVNDSFGLSK